MAPITGVPTFASAAINPNTATAASHASGTTPQTASSNSEPREDNEPTVTAAEATSTSTSTYAQAQPGAAPVPGPAPTGAATAALYTPTPTTTSPPTTTDPTTISLPAPQPGARPVPPPAVSQLAEANDLPPPPKVGEVPKPASYYTRATPTGTSTAPSAGFGGYNTTAQIPAPAQGLNVPNSTSTPYNTVYQPAANNTSLPTHNYTPGSGGDAFQDEEEGVGQEIWKTAKSWVQTAGSKLAEVEAEVWKRVG